MPMIGIAWMAKVSNNSEIIKSGAGSMAHRGIGVLTCCMIVLVSASAMGDSYVLPKGTLEGTFLSNIQIGKETHWWGESVKAAVKKCGDQAGEPIRLKNGEILLGCNEFILYFKWNGLYLATCLISAERYKAIASYINAQLGSSGRHEDGDGNEAWLEVYYQNSGKIIGSILVSEMNGGGHWVALKGNKIFK